MNVPAEIPAAVCGLHLSREFSPPACRSCCWEQGAPLFLSFSFSERLEGKWSMWSKRAGAEGGASKTLWEGGRRTPLTHDADAFGLGALLEMPTPGFMS